MTTPLLLVNEGVQIPLLAAGLASPGIHVLGAVNDVNLVREVVWQSPDLLMCWGCRVRRPSCWARLRCSGHAKAVNRAGQLRMLSQRLPKASEALPDQLDPLTERYERSLQMLINSVTPLTPPEMRSRKLQHSSHNSAPWTMRIRGQVVQGGHDAS